MAQIDPDLQLTAVQAEPYGQRHVQKISDLNQEFIRIDEMMGRLRDVRQRFDPNKDRHPERDDSCHSTKDPNFVVGQNITKIANALEAEVRTLEDISVDQIETRLDELPTTKHILNPQFREGTFAWAEEQAARGRRVTRECWRGSSMFAEFTEHSENGRFVIRVRGTGSRQEPTQAHKEATDWVIAPEPDENAPDIMTQNKPEVRIPLRQWAIETAIRLNTISGKSLDMQATIGEAEKLMAFVEKGSANSPEAD